MRLPCLVATFATLALAQNAARPAPDLGAIYLFKVDPDGVDPIARLDFGNAAAAGPVQGSQLSFLEPVDFFAEEARRKTDLDRLFSHYRSGAPVTLYSGGQRVANAKLEAAYSESEYDAYAGGCYALGTHFNPRTLPGSLAVGGPANSGASAVQSHASSRRKATAADTQNFLRLTREWLRGYGLSPQLIARAKLRQLVSTRLRSANPGRALIGILYIEGDPGVEGPASLQAPAPTPSYRLLAVAEQLPGSARFRLTLGSLSVVPDGKKSQVELEYVDQLDFQTDLDGDGDDEFVTKSSFGEAWFYQVWSYSVWGATEATWQAIYEGGGGGC